MRPVELPEVNSTNCNRENAAAADWWKDCMIIESELASVKRIHEKVAIEKEKRKTNGEWDASKHSRHDQEKK